MIRLALRQRALTALGYHSGPVDGYYGPETREAVRGFQRELGFDETGALTPRQTTLLICHAAQTARETSVQNTLGIMYATGLGVEQNTDWLLNGWKRRPGAMTRTPISTSPSSMAPAPCWAATACAD